MVMQGPIFHISKFAISIAKCLPRGGFRFLNVLSNIIPHLKNWPISLPFYEGLEIEADLSKNIFFPLLKYGCYPHQLVEDLVIMSFLRGGDKVIDVGANIGWVSLIYSWCIGKEGVVYAIEPSKQSFPYLERIAKKINQIQVYNFALSDCSGVQYFVDEAMLDRSHLLTESNEKSYNVQVYMLDDWAENEKLDRLDFLK